MKNTGRKLILTAVAAVILSSCKSAADPVGSAVSLSGMDRINSRLEENITTDLTTTYEVFLYSYYDSDNDGIGDLRGLKEKLDYIQDTGFTAIWLMPVMTSPTYHKYDVADYYSIDPQYGTIDDFKDLISDCSERGIRIILDLVLNHTSVQHPWFAAAADYLKTHDDYDDCAASCPYFNAYHFSREFQNGYAALGDSGWYYEARFWEGMPDLNLDDEGVREEILSIMKYWLDLGVGGFRLDAVTSYYTGDPEKNTAFLKWLCESGKAMRSDCYFVGEAWTNRSEIAALYDSGIDSLFDFPFADANGIIHDTLMGAYGAEDYVQAQVSEQEAYILHNPDYLNAPFYTNHDMARSAGYYAGDDGTKTKLAGAMNLLMSGNVFVYYGEEAGMKGSGKDENKRAPMYWSDTAQTGICTGPPDMDTIAMKFAPLDEQMKDPYSVYSYYRNAIKLRNAFPSLAFGTVSLRDDLSDEEIAVYTKSDGIHPEVCIVMNLGGQSETVDVSALKQQTLAGVLLAGEEEISLQEGKLTVPPYGIAVLKE